MLILIPSIISNSKRIRREKESLINSAAYYPYYTNLDLNTIPYNIGSGGWGIQVPLQAPTVPTTVGSTSVASLASLQSAVASGARSITVTASFTGGTINSSLTDCEIILNPGVYISGDLLLGVASSRFRIRGPTIGTYSGGRVHSLRFGGGLWNNVLIDGIGLTGDTDHAVQVHNGCNVFAMTNCRMLSDRCGLLAQAPFTHVTFAGNSIVTGQAAGSDPAWGLRCGGVGPFAVYDNHIEGNRYHRLRMAPPSNEHLVWVRNNRFVDLIESRIFWVNSGSGSQEGLSSGVWFLNNTVYANGGGLSIDSAHGGPGSGAEYSNGNFSSAAYVRNNDNIIYGPFTNSDIMIDNPNLVDGTKTGNTFFATTTPPVPPLDYWN